MSVEAGQGRGLVRGLRALEELAVSPGGATQAELGRALGVNRSTAHRLLVTLEETGYVRRDRDARYHLTPQVLRLAARSLERISLRREAAPVLRRLSAETGLSTHLAMPVSGQVIYVDGCDGPGLVTINAGLGAVAPVHCTATGKALAAHLEAGEARALLHRSGCLRHTDRTVCDPAQVELQWAEVRAQGYAVDDEEFEPGVRCVAAPVFDHENTVAGVIGVSGTTARLSRERLPAVVGLVVTAADELSSGMGAARRAVGAAGRDSRRTAPIDKEGWADE